MNIAIKYRDQVLSVKGRTRADKAIRYYHYERDKRGLTQGIEEKERRSLEILKIALERSKSPVVSCSFGIDSVVTLYMTRKALAEMGRDPSEVAVVWNDTLNEFPEVRLYAKRLTDEWNLKIVKTTPKKPLKKIIDDNGGITSDYFTARKGDRREGQPLSEKCCENLKHEPMRRALKENKWDLIINGLRADESRQRFLASLRDGEYFYSSHEWKAFVVRPILWFTETDIWEYVERENIPYNGLYDKNLIQKYPKDIVAAIKGREDELKAAGLDPLKLERREVATVNRKQAILLESLGFQIFMPRTGCMMCPIRVKYGYLHFMRIYYPKVFKAMIENLGYGRVLLDMVPQEVKNEVRFFLGIDITAENAHEFLQDILNAKPCIFDNFS